ncbi:MAG: mechanosensitive ion channel family protein [Planctomycetes bacterium]|nr:mechanosensitive ion channel family protein [Planctomycetota bacterium]
MQDKTPDIAVKPVQTLQDTASTFKRFFDESAGTVGKFAPSVVGAIVFFIAAYIMSGWLSHWLLRALIKAHVEATIAKFLATLCRWGLVVMSTVACLGMFGVNVAAFAAVLGAVGLAIGLALQGSLSNLAAGVMLMLFRPFKVGDAVSVAGQSGIVDEIELFSTRLDTADNRRIIIPNSTAFNAIVENTTHHPIRRVDISVGVEYSADMAATRQALMTACNAVPEAKHDPSPGVVCVRFGKSAVEWQVLVWCKKEDFPIVQQATMEACQDQLLKAGIRMVPML